MKMMVRRIQVVVWLCVNCVGLVPALSAHEPKLRGTLKGHTDSVQSVVFSPDGKTLASASNDRTIKLWEVQTGMERATLKGHTDGVQSVAFSPDGKTLASASNDKSIKLWDVQTGVEQATLKAHRFGVASVAFSPDGKTLASGGQEPTVQLWDVATSKKGVAIGPENVKSAACVAFSPNGKTVGGGGGAALGGAGLWDVTSGKYLEPTFGQVQGVHSVAFSPDGKFFAVGSTLTGKIKLLDVRDHNNLPKPIAIEAQRQFVSSLAFSPDSKTLASGGKNIILWDISALKAIAILEEHTESVNSVAFSPDGKMLASGSRDKTIRLWDVAVVKHADR